MSDKGKFYGCIKEGKLVLDNKAVFQAWIGNFEGKRLQISIKEEGKDISDEQWGYLYACVYQPIAEYTGHTVEEVDGILKKRHLTKNKGKKTEYVKDKSKLNKKELAKYIDNCIIDAAHIGVTVLPPNKYKG